ncbi:uncharacterized protein [Watersipora subatra]|uniref:uncharacterized protein n=1 Tax=Watersipora subatra TaxID=2589382 RepID=UPI00355C0496
MSEVDRDLVKISEKEFITLKDGVKLATRIWLPYNACESQQVAAVFEFLPYGKRDGTTCRDEITYQHFAKHGYAGVRVDMRGYGESTGLALDEYVKQEQDDALECIEWITCRPWCNGRVGMMGISWGGFNSLQVAARQPEALKAIIAVCFTDDRFADDIHYKGGAMLSDNVKWAMCMALVNSLPPDPLVSDDWLANWINRLSHLGPAAETWLQNQTRGDYYKQGSICEDYTKVQVPSLLIGGYADGYTNSVQRTFDNIQCPKRAIVGPWVHLYPHLATPGPLWGFCTEAVNWWDHWLKDPQVQCDGDKFITYIQRNVPVPCPAEVEGRWVENPRSTKQTFYLSEGTLSNNCQGDSVIDICSSEVCGQQIITHFPTSLSTISMEQSPDDKLSCIFDTPPFEAEVDYVGRPSVTLLLASDKPVANVFLRLCVVSADQSRMVAYTGVNLNMTDDFSSVVKMQVGVFKKVTAKLDFIGESVKIGQRLRLSLSTSCFPMFIPNPEHTTVSLDLSGCCLDMPLLTSATPLAEAIPVVTDCKRNPVSINKPASYQRTTKTNDSGELVVTTTDTSGEIIFLEHGLVTERASEYTDTISPDDPTTARLHAVEKLCWSRGDDWKVNVHCKLDFTMDRECFHTHETRVAEYNGEVVFTRSYESHVQRNGH